MFTGGIGKGRVVFCMTQCHAGGFHYLGVPREMTPNPKWFTRVPDWVKPGEMFDFPRAAGFTATDEFSPAAGCVTDPDPKTWAGYERFVPENLLGLDLFTLKPTPNVLRSFAEAHVAAILEDETIDKPRSTSEQYLERWANLIETRLVTETNLTPKIKQLVVAYKRNVDGESPAVSDAAFRERQVLFRKLTDKMSEQNPRVNDLLHTGNRAELEIASAKTSRSRPPKNRNTRERRPQNQRRRGEDFEKLWKDTVRPAWQIAVRSNHVADIVPPMALDFEKHLLELESRGSNYVTGSEDSLLREIYWQSGYSDPETLNPAKAAAIARWGAGRVKKILLWS